MNIKLTEIAIFPQQMLMAILGVFGGPSNATFAMGLFLPFINRRAVLIGFFCGAGKLSP